MVIRMITKKSLELAFRTAARRQDIDVLDFTIRKASSPGEGFMSAVYGVNAVFKQGAHIKSSDVLVKVFTDDPHTRSIVEEGELFKKEIGFYSAVVPALGNFQRERNVLPWQPALPKYYFGGENEIGSLLMMEDLRLMDFKLADFKRGLDYDHCHLVMKELAKLHALSFAYKRGNDQIIHEEFADSMFDVLLKESYVDKLRYDVDLVNAFKNSVAVFSAITDDDESKIKLANAFIKMGKDPYAALKECLTHPTEQFGVICHGDLWGNNVMFRYGLDGRPVDVRLIDFQMWRYALPTTDLSYFLFTSTTQKTRKQHLNDLLRLYHKSFINTLDHVGTDSTGFTYDVLKEMFRNTALFGILRSLYNLHHTLADPSSLAKLDNAHEVEAAAEFWLSLAANADDTGALMNIRVAEVVHDALSLGL